MLNFTENYFSPTHQDLFHLALNWTPRLIVIGLAGYYSLGIAYEKGIMATIDRLAIRILNHSMGYAGIGAFMPVFQWYSAWGVRLTAAIGAGILYDLTLRTFNLVYTFFFSPSIQQPLILAPDKRPSPSLKQAPLHREMV